MATVLVQDVDSNNAPVGSVNAPTSTPPTSADIAAIRAQSNGDAPIDRQTQRKVIPVQSEVDKTKYTPELSLDPRNIVKVGYDPLTRQTPKWAPHIDNATGQVAYHDEDVGTYLKPVVDLLEVTHGALNDLGAYRAAAHANDEWSTGQAVLKIAETAEKTQMALAKRWDAISATLSKQAAHFEQELAKPVKAAADRPHIAMELRAHFKAMGTGAVPALSDAIYRGETDVAASVLGAPYQLSGLTPEMHSMLTTQLNTKMNPQIANRLAAVKAAQAYLDNLGGLVLTETNRVVGVSDAKLTKLRVARTEAEKARALVDKRFEIKGI